MYSTVTIQQNKVSIGVQWTIDCEANANEKGLAIFKDRALDYSPLDFAKKKKVRYGQRFTQWHWIKDGQWYIQNANCKVYSCLSSARQKTNKKNILKKIRLVCLFN